MSRRLELQTILETILGSSNVYYQPPESVKLSFPAIIYKRNNIDLKYAADHVYRKKVEYTITVVDKNPDSEISLKLLTLPLISTQRVYTTNGLNHEVFTLYY